MHASGCQLYLSSFVSLSPLPIPDMRVLVLTYGTRGDVQPYVALGSALVAAGHECDICTHRDFELFIKEYGLGFLEYGGENPQEMFNYCVKEGIFSRTFVREIPKVAYRWMDEWAKVWT